jgi:anaerobic ribonucleoside-triphosphate reductase activating protein
MVYEKPAVIEQPAAGREDIFLNVAAICTRTRSLGPGLRAVLWVQGCPFHCPGCIAPDWIPIRPAHIYTPEQLVDQLLADPEVQGVTFSGGEPMLQALGLANLAYLARRRRDVSIICFTGFPKHVLETTPPGPGVKELLDQVDVLIDGPYISRLNDNLGMRGSHNQKIYYLTDRLSAFDLEENPRKAEIQIQDGQAMMVGVPPMGLEKAFHQAINRANHLQMEMLRHER